MHQGEWSALRRTDVLISSLKVTHGTLVLTVEGGSKSMT